MKKTPPSKIKSRYGKILFAKDSPFTHKVVQDKTKYNRKKKNPRKDGDFFGINLYQST